jgi:vacuolar-type H+-ATPase catalytic subunit A/Vma1
MKLLKIWEGDRIIRHFWAFREENHSKKNNPSIAQKQVKLTYYSVSLNNWHENHVHHENPVVSLIFEILRGANTVNKHNLLT